jgi:alpha-N-arabinofuranosidase
MATIQVDPGRVLARLDRRIFGGFIEHLGRCIYGGVFEPGSPLSDERGFRSDVLEALRDLRVPVLRWPGGNFVSGYHWLDGVGPVGERPRRSELAWRTVESNRFGTDEFMDYSRALGAEPYVCVNLGSGSPEEAQAWVEYCNVAGGTHWSDLRRRHGREEPYGVRYWGLGNEMYGSWQIGALDADDYVKKAREAAKLMRWTDPSVQLVSCGNTGWSDWDVRVIDGLAAHVDLHSIHLYTGSRNHHANVFMPHLAERAIRICAGLIERARHEQRIAHQIRIAYDEWGVWYREFDAQKGLEERYTLSDALAVASFLNGFVRGGEAVGLANLAQLVNVIAPVFTSPEGHFRQTIYHPLRLYSELTRAESVDVVVEAPRQELTDAEASSSPWSHHYGDLGPFSLLDAIASRDPDAEHLTLAVSNRDAEAAHQVQVRLAEGWALAGGVVHLLHGAGLDATNSFEEPDRVSVSAENLDVGGRNFERRLPAHSLSFFDLRLSRA